MSCKYQLITNYMKSLPLELGFQPVQDGTNRWCSEDSGQKTAGRRQADTVMMSPRPDRTYTCPGKASNHDRRVD